MWRNPRSFTDLVSNTSSSISSTPTPSTTIKQSESSLSDLQNENRILREEISNLCNQIAWLSEHPYTSTPVTEDSADFMHPLTDKATTLEKSPPLATQFSMVLTRDVGTMIDANIFLVDAIVVEEAMQILPENDPECTNNSENILERVNLNTYESRYHYQKVLNQTLDQRIHFLEEKCQQLEDKLQNYNQLKLEVATLKWQRKEWQQEKRELKVTMDKYEKLLYQSKYEHQRDQTLLEQFSQRLETLQSEKKQAEDALKGSNRVVDGSIGCLFSIFSYIL